jgi:hypothetical protein
MLTTANKKAPKTFQDFTCEKCDFISSKAGDYNRHLLTAKHLKANNANLCATNLHQCDSCKHVFKHASSLSRHKKKCASSSVGEAHTNKLYKKNNIFEVIIKENMDFKNIILDLVKSNTDLQKQMLDVCKINTTINTTHHTNNSHNKTFNLQFFLNETCKDAMNIMEFVDSMTLEFSDLEEVGKLGYVEGISNIIIRKLNEMDVHKRPIHCSDAKREIMYVKDDNVWEKENSSNDRIRKAIKHITKKNGDMMIPWSQKHPSCMNIEHRLNDVYVQIMGQCMGGKESFVESENKIMKKIAKAVFIDKTC